MARHPLAHYPSDVEPAAAEIFEDYLTAIARRLPGPRRARTAAIAELRDGLCDGWGHYRRRGLGDTDAARETVTEFGPASVVADAYTGVLADLHARRTAQMLVFTGPIIGLLWLVTLAPGQTPNALLLAVPMLTVLVAAGALAGLITVATTGRAAHLLPDIRGLPQRAAVTACLATGAVDLTVLTLAAERFLTTPTTPPAVLALAGLASLTRIGFSQYAARTHLKTRPASQ
jgi:hypothetical protein